jgi:hypothetical protein
MLLLRVLMQLNLVYHAVVNLEDDRLHEWPLKLKLRLSIPNRPLHAKLSAVDSPNVSGFDTQLS